MYRANFGDGTHTTAFQDIRDARLAKWGRAAVVQYRTFIEQHDGGPLSDGWIVVEPSRASGNVVVTGRKSDTLMNTNVGTGQKKAFHEALEAARQAVKPLVKKSLQAEDVTNDLLSFRMKQASSA